MILTNHVEALSSWHAQAKAKASNCLILHHLLHILSVDKTHSKRKKYLKDFAAGQFLATTGVAKLGCRKHALHIIEALSCSSLTDTHIYWIILHTKTGSLPGFWANYALSPNTAGAREHCIKTKSLSHSVALPHSGSPANHGGIACIVARQVYVFANILDDRTSYCPEHVSHSQHHLHRAGSSLSN